MLRKALNELKLWSLQREFTFADPSVSQVHQQPQQGGRKVPLIKEYQSVLAEVGDLQSLVASLKQAQAHSVFKVSGACVVAATGARLRPEIKQSHLHAWSRLNVLRLPHATVLLRLRVISSHRMHGACDPCRRRWLGGRAGWHSCKKAWPRCTPSSANGCTWSPSLPEARCPSRPGASRTLTPTSGASWGSFRLASRCRDAPLWWCWLPCDSTSPQGLAAQAKSGVPWFDGRGWDPGGVYEC